MNDEGRTHARGGAVDEAEAAVGVVAENQNSAAASDAAAAKAAPAPIFLTAGERKAFRMGVLRGVEVAADFVRVGDGVVAERMELCRIAIAARGIDCEAPQFWPQRGGA